MLVRVEEVVPVEDVVSELPRLGDRDRVRPRAALELERPSVRDQPRLDVAERRAEGRDAHMADCEPHRGVGLVQLVRACQVWCRIHE